MTHHPIRTLNDGTRVYSNGTRYKPVPRDQRKNGINRPASPTAFRWYGRWFEPLVLLDDDERSDPREMFPCCPQMRKVSSSTASSTTASS
jgi:hypothetical protein